MRGEGNLVPRVFSAFEIAARIKPWQIAGHVFPKVLEISIVLIFMIGLFMDTWSAVFQGLLPAAILNAVKTPGTRLGRRLRDMRWVIFEEISNVNYM